MTPDDYWKTYEHEVDSLGSFLEAVPKISGYVAPYQTRFVWRGVSDASFGLHSKLARAYHYKNNGAWPNEKQLRGLETAVLEEARAWPLQWHDTGGRLSALPLLAVLQHFGAPTRLIDFTFNPLVALCFAVEQTAAQRAAGTDGRVFAVDVAGYEVDDTDAEDSEPWWLAKWGSVASPWCQRAVVWTPPPIEQRIVRQQACFLMGGVPSTSTTRYVDDPTRRQLRAGEVRECMSIHHSRSGSRTQMRSGETWIDSSATRCDRCSQTHPDSLTTGGLSGSGSRSCIARVVRGSPGTIKPWCRGLSDPAWHHDFGM